MKRHRVIHTALTGVLALLGHRATAIDLRFDVATNNNNGNDTDWFGPQQLPALNFYSAHGHDIEQGGKSNQSTIQAAGNTMGVYYDYFHTLYSTTETASAAASTIQSWIKSNYGGSAETSQWLVLNEVDSSTWNSSSGNAYRSWLVSTMSALNGLGYTKLILFTESSLASKTYASTWQGIAQYAYIGDECFIDGQVVVSDNFSVSKLQTTYQNSLNGWTSVSNGAGLSASKILEDEHFSVNNYDPSYYWGADGISGTQWQMAIEARDVAIHNVTFGGFIGYAWDKDAQATGNQTVDLANQISYEKAYASTLVAQSELPCWTGNDGTTSWNDYLNWTGGLPSTTADPFPLLAATNPTLPRQTTANFLGAIKTSTNITLDGNQSVTTLLFDSANSYNIMTGTGGTLTMTGSNASITVNSGTHFILAPLVLSSNVTANMTGTLLISSSTITNSGVTLTKTGSGTLTIFSSQKNSTGSAISMTAGTLNISTDCGSAGSATLAFYSTGGTTNFNSVEHLTSLSITAGSVKLSGAGKPLVTQSISIGSTGTLDITQNSLIVNYTGTSPINNIAGYLKSGYNSSAWNGHGINSSTAAGNSNHTTALGYAEASDLGLDHGGTFAGQTIVAEAVLVKYTYYGDENLDGVVNLDDFSIFVDGFNGLGSGWVYGDFNYDGVINQNDFSLFIQGFNLNGQPLSELSGAILAEGQLSSSQQSAMLSAIPEPAALTMMLIPLTMVTRPRKPRPHPGTLARD